MSDLFEGMADVTVSDEQRAGIGAAVVAASDSGRQYFTGKLVTRVRRETKDGGDWLLVEFEGKDCYSYIPPWAPEATTIGRILGATV